jgi:hypothetical protein
VFVQSRKVVSEKKLKVIKAVLNVDYEPEQDGEGSQHGTAHLRPLAADTFDEVRRDCNTAVGHMRQTYQRLAYAAASCSNGSCD